MEYTSHSGTVLSIRSTWQIGICPATTLRLADRAPLDWTYTGGNGVGPPIIADQMNFVPGSDVGETG